jgi:alpha-glucosidase
MIKDAEFRDNPPNPAYTPGSPNNTRQLSIYNANRPEIHDLIAEMRAVVDAFPDRVLIGEIYLPIQQLMTYYGKDNRGVNLPFNFQLLQCAWSAEAVARVLVDYHSALPTGAWPNWVTGNHDQPRVASRVGAKQASVAAMLLLTLPGTLTLYYGEELGMTNVPIPPEDVQDPAEKNEPGIGAGRDPERTPMQWDASPNAGFTSGLRNPWLPLAADFTTVNVAAQDHNPASMLALYRDLIRLRRTHRALIDSGMQSISASGSILRYQRANSEEALLIVLNLSHEPAAAELQDMPGGTILRSTCVRADGERVGSALTLQAAEGLTILLDKPAT